MLLSLNWLREFVPYEGTAQELGDRLTMVGLELDGLTHPYDGIKDIVVGYVAECGRHPEADKLSVCRVDVGDEVLDIVCGAPNVAQGQKVAVVKVGTTLPNGLKVKKAKLRGAPSNGMICSEFELGLSEEHDGILVLDPGAQVGARLVDVLGLDDTVLDISITPNRGDCLSVLGFAREVSALTGLPLTLPAVHLNEQGPDAQGELQLEILQPELCPLYHARIIENTATHPAPAAMRYRLNSIGVRSISNLVDVTNYILMELGQPLHAFDLDTFRGGRVMVRGADEGENLVTLDGQNRTLTAADITIRDAEGILCLGGVMGGLDSEITGKSKRVFLESAIFNPSNIRKTARRLGLQSEASYRFERGVDQQGATFALDRAAALMAELSGGYVRPGIIKAEPRPWHPVTVTLRRERAEAIIGVPVAADFCEKTLTSLGCALEKEAQSGDQWKVATPSWRPDLTREADLIEEVARVYGVDRIPAELPIITQSLEQAGKGEDLFGFLSRIKHWGRGVGLNEAVNYSFVSHKELDHIGVPGGEGSDRINIMNPLSDDLNVLRTHLAPGLLNTLRNNLSQGAASVRIFEVASAFYADAASETTAREVPHLGIMLHGSRYEQGWPQPEGELDFYDLKGIVEHLAQSFNLPAPTFSTESAADALPWFSPSVSVAIGATRIGTAGRVKPAIADPYHARKDVWLAEIDLLALRSLHTAIQPRFESLPVFPPVRRDITFITPQDTQAGAIIDCIEGLRIPLLSSVRLIDLFEPKDRAEKNQTFRLTFRHANRTLKDSEADKQRDVIANAVQTTLGVRV